MQELLKTTGLTRRLEGELAVTLVEDINLSISTHEFVAITGPSGSGKSSLMYLIGLLDTPSSGEIWIDGTATSYLNNEQIAALRLEKIGFVFQFHFLLPEFSAIENVMLPMQKLGQASRKQMHSRASHYLEQLGLKEHVNKLPSQLSGGQSQRVAIARAIANEPKIILADEPTGNLDTASSAAVQSILEELAHQQGCAVLAVTHDTDFANNTDRQIVLVDGKLQTG